MTLDLGDWANVAQISSVVGGVGIGVFSMWRRLEKRQDRIEATTGRLETKISNIERQFGPNGGGLREAVNNMSATVSKIENRVTKIGDELMRLSGEFSEHKNNNPS